MLHSLYLELLVDIRNLKKYLNPKIKMYYIIAHQSLAMVVAFIFFLKLFSLFLPGDPASDKLSVLLWESSLTILYQWRSIVVVTLGCSSDLSTYFSSLFLMKKGRCSSQKIAWKADNIIWDFSLVQRTLQGHRISIKYWQEYFLCTWKKCTWID